MRDDDCYYWGDGKYNCEFGPQGISAGCWDDYLNDLDCQWVDLTDVKPGQYIFKITINPDRVAERNYNNNVAVCDLSYDGNEVQWRNCQLKSA